MGGRNTGTSRRPDRWLPASSWSPSTVC